MKFCAIATVVGFAGFLVFGYLAFFASKDIGALQIVDITLSLAFLVGGGLAWRKISRGECNFPAGRA